MSNVRPDPVLFVSNVRPAPVLLTPCFACFRAIHPDSVRALGHIDSSCHSFYQGCRGSEWAVVEIIHPGIVAHFLEPGFCLLDVLKVGQVFFCLAYCSLGERDVVGEMAHQGGGR